MAGRECYHCKQWVEEGEAHDCWTTTESALTQDLSDDLRDAWARLRETAAEFGEQRIYASHNSIMFSRKSCYFFVRPKKYFLELCVFLGRAVKGMELLSTLPRGAGPLGFYEKPEQYVPIVSVRVASDLPAGERTELELLRTDTPTFTAFLEARRTRRESWYLDSVGHVELCNVPLPVRAKSPPPAKPAP
jgi:hypothetical protein